MQEDEVSLGDNVFGVIEEATTLREENGKLKAELLLLRGGD